MHSGRTRRTASGERQDAERALRHRSGANTFELGADDDRQSLRPDVQKASDLLEQANDARATVSDLDPLLTDFDDRQMRGCGPDEGRGVTRQVTPPAPRMNA
jgi:hypothetical protein